MAKPEAVKNEETAVAVKDQAGALAVIEFEDDANAGFEEADRNAYAIPFFRQIQAISPQAKKQNAAYIEGAEEGDFFNTVTGKLYKGEPGPIVICCHFKHVYNEWAPDRGGFRGTHSAAEYAQLRKATRQDSKGNLFEANEETGNQLVDTREHYLLVINEDGSYTPAVMALTSSDIKRSKKWMSFMRELKLGNGKAAPMQSQYYRLVPVPEKNDKGEWVGVTAEHIGALAIMDHYDAARKFYEAVRSGLVNVAPVGDDEVPF